MGEVKITDLVPQETLDKLKELDGELKTLLDNYTNTAKELAKGLQINVKIVGDIDKLDKLYIERTKEATSTTERLNAVVSERSRVLAQTTPVVARQLMEQERVNKAQREAYTDQDKVNKLIEKSYDTYEQQLASMVRIGTQLEKNKKQQKENEKALKAGSMSAEEFTKAQMSLTASNRELMQEKRKLNSIMTAEEKANMSAETSYVRMSQQLELLKKKYKELGDEGKNTDFGNELEAAIQNLDAHLKDLAADMGEHQRNVGNYAIASQNGIVTTDSVVAAMEKEARTTQDLIDQTKILEEAKQMLNQDDVNYQSTLDAMNAKIEENKRKLMDVSDILGKEATTVAEAEAQNKRLSEAIKHIDLTSADAKKRLEEMRAQIQSNNEIIAEATGSNEKFADSMLSMIGVNSNFGSSLQGLETSGNFLDGMKTKITAFGNTLMGILSNPWVLAFLGIGGIVAGFKWWYDYNKGLIEASRLTENFTGLTGEAADKITTDMQAIADHMGKSYSDTIGAANTLVQQFGISWEDAMTLMEDGIQAGADMNGKFVENINQFAPALRDAGVSAQELVSILAETRNGIFNEKGVQDIVKVGTKLKAMTKQMADALDACGISSKQLKKDLDDGNITMLEAVQKVATKLKELPENSQEAGMVMKTVFGKTAAEGGTLLIQSIADVNTNLDEAKKRMGELGEVNREQMEAQKELNEIVASLFKMSGTSFEKMTIKAKTYVTQGLTAIIKGCVDIVNWFVELYNKSHAFRTAIGGVIAVFKSLWSVAKGVFGLIADGFKALGEGVEGIVLIFDGEFEKGLGKIKDMVVNGVKGIKNAIMSTGKEIGTNFADEIANAADSRLEKVTVGNNVNISGLGARDNNNDKNSDKKIPEGLGDKKGDKKAASEAEKAAKEELKRIYQLEESKLEAMADGHEKELAMIRLKFRKKIDEITGNSETEKQLRVQLALQCEEEVAKCELQYQEELSKINLDNRLEAVEKGSKEELDLKLAKLEAERKAEIKAAEKTGADVELIHAKFNKRRKEMEEDFAHSQADIIMKRYANEQTSRDNEMMSEIADLRQQYAEKMKMAKGNADEIERLHEDLAQKESEISFKYAQKTSQDAIDMLESILDTEDLSAEDRLKYEQDLARAKNELNTLMADHAIAEENRKVKAARAAMMERIRITSLFMQATSDMLAAIEELVNNLFDQQIEKIENLQEANEAAGEEEQERITDLVNKKVITEEEGEARKRAAEAQTARENEKLEKKKQQLKIKQAKWDKANALIQATISTSLAIMNALQTQPFWLGIALAAIAGATGAVQIATIAQQPIPAYAKGTDRHEGGPAIVGDGGRREVVLFNGSAWLTPDTPTLVDIPAGASVLPDVNLLGDNPAGGVPLPVTAGNNQPVKAYDDSAIRRGISELAQLIKAQTRQQHNDAYMAEYERYKNSKI